MEYYIQVVVTTVLPVLTAVCGYLISYFNAKKTIQDLSKSKTELEKAVLENSYFICPACGKVIHAKDIEWKDSKHEEIQG